MPDVVHDLRIFLLSALALAIASCADSTAPYQPDDPRLFLAVAAGSGHTCGINAEGRLLCWGQNEAGQLGDGTTEDRTFPAPVAGDLRFVSVSASGSNTCGITDDASAYCWGSNYFGQLGNGTDSSHATPAPVNTSDIVFSAISAGGARTCGLAVNGTAYCWGLGPLGDGTQDTVAAPVKVDGEIRFNSLSAGGDHTCGVAADQTAYCWGSNFYGELGTTTTETCGFPEEQNTWPCSTVPLVVSGDITFSQLVTGWGHTCGIALDDDGVYCWGDNYSGQLGDGTATDRPTPTRVISPDVMFTTITAASGTTCGVAPDGTAYCWGGQPLGNGSDSSAVAPTPVSGSVRFEHLSVGGTHTCGLGMEGFIYCWGSNRRGQLGDDSDVLGWDTPVVVWGW
jgi:alpha-tubulin suppressor-like RCC1 family protein